MKRMVKNGDLIDVEPDGTITVAGKPVGGGGENERELILTAPYAKTTNNKQLKLYLDEETLNKISNCYYETVKIYFNDGNPLGIFHVLYYHYEDIQTFGYVCILKPPYRTPDSTWFGKANSDYIAASLFVASDSAGKFLTISKSVTTYSAYLDQSKFDKLYKLADKPTGDGTYVLKATVSSGAVTYTWVAQ